MPKRTDIKKVVLLSKSGYDQKHDALLKQLIVREIDLFSAVGRDCDLWEDAMDAISEEKDIHINTTSHANETLEEVLAFAKLFAASNQNQEIEIIEI